MSTCVDDAWVNQFIRAHIWLNPFFIRIYIFEKHLHLPFHNVKNGRFICNFLRYDVDEKVFLCWFLKFKLQVRAVNARVELKRERKGKSFIFFYFLYHPQGKEKVKVFFRFYSPSFSHHHHRFFFFLFFLGFIYICVRKHFFKAESKKSFCHRIVPHELDALKRRKIYFMH